MRVFMLSQTKEPKLNRQNGTALIEAAICLPLIFLLLAGLVEAGRYFDRLYTVSRIAYEGARYAARVVGIEDGTNVGTSTAPGTVRASVQNQVRDRIADMLVPLVLPWTRDEFGVVHLDVAQANAKSISMAANIDVDRSDKKNAAGAITSTSSNKVAVTISVPFEPLIFPHIALFPVHTIRARATAPYLFVRENKPAFNVGSAK